MNRIQRSRKAFTEKMKKISLEESEKIKIIEEMAKKLMADHGVEAMHFRFGYGWKYRGRCTRDTIIIELFFALRSDIATVRNTILHEIAHAVVGIDCRHREEWQNKAREMGVTWSNRYRK